MVSALHGMRLASRDIPVHFQTISKGVHPSQIGLHSPEYIDHLSQPFEPWEDARPLDAHDTIQTRTSFDAALEAVHCAHTGVDLLSSGEESKVLIAARPAGHHATRKHAMGFCILGGSALAAQYARDKYGWKVAILDFDYHHGNGTEDLVQDEPNIFFASTQTTKAWPLTGASGRSGKYDNILNVDLPYTARNADMIEAWTGIFDQVRKFAPDLIVVSAGVDAHHLDFLGTFRCDLELYVRGKTLGVKDHESGKNHRLKTLDIELADRVEAMMLEQGAGRAQVEAEGEKEKAAERQQAQEARAQEEARKKVREKAAQQQEDEVKKSGPTWAERTATRMAGGSQKDAQALHDDKQRGPLGDGSGGRQQDPQQSQREEDEQKPAVLSAAQKAWKASIREVRDTAKEFIRGEPRSTWRDQEDEDKGR